MSGINLGELIDALARLPQDAVISNGFGAPDSYRGYYEQLAFSPAQNVTVSSMLAHANSAVDETFMGYKGGDYKMDLDSLVWIAEYGTSFGDAIGPTILALWANECALKGQQP